jgi:glutamate/tyrosine decarboxylase-like PLP-dependent enzyme
MLPEGMRGGLAVTREEKVPEVSSPDAPDDKSLDPGDWSAWREQGHRMLDDMFDYLAQVRDRPVWQPMPDAVRGAFDAELPLGPTDLETVHREFQALVQPYATGNVHPGFMGWVHGGGTAVGMLAELLAGGLNANLGGRDHAPIEVERQIVRWMRDLYGFPDGASGLFVTGSSTGNLIGVLVARQAALGAAMRADGVAEGPRLTAYVSTAAHGCIPRAMEIAGLGSAALRLVPVDAEHRIDVAAAAAMIRADRAAGQHPFLLIGNAGTVGIGATDDLAALAALARAEGLWFHVDGAFGALGIMSPELTPRLAGIEQAQSLALDFHKWGQVPYDAGFVLVADGEIHRATFASPADYLRRETRGLAGGSPWPCDFGLDLSRGFRALKTWMTLRVYGIERLGRMMARTCALARYLERRVAAEPALEMMAPVPLNIACFRHRGPDRGTEADDPAADALNAAIVIDLHEQGIAAPSTITLGGRLAIRAAIVNHRTEERDLDALVDGVLRLGSERAAGR